MKVVLIYSSNPQRLCTSWNVELLLQLVSVYAVNNCEANKKVRRPLVFQKRRDCVHFLLTGVIPQCGPADAEWADYYFYSCLTMTLYFSPQLPPLHVFFYRERLSQRPHQCSSARRSRWASGLSVCQTPGGGDFPLRASAKQADKSRGNCLIMSVLSKTKLKKPWDCSCISNIQYVTSGMSGCYRHQIARFVFSLSTWNSSCLLHIFPLKENAMI